MLNKYLRNLLLLLIISCAAGLFAQPLSGEFKAVASFSLGEKPGQLMWNATLSGGVPDGSFQGPMVFLTDKNGNFWIGDSLNARIVVFSPVKGQLREIDLIAARKKLGLASDVILLDMVPAAGGKLLVADAQNNCVIELEMLSGKALKAFKSDDSGRGRWVQINRINSDKNGRIYLEDLPSMKTQILTSNGEPLQTLEGELGLAVSPDGRAAMLVMDPTDRKTRHVVVSPVHGSPGEKVASLVADEEILWAAALGFSKKGLAVVYDTPKKRYYALLDEKFKISKTIAVDYLDPGYDPCRPDWISPDGRIFAVQIKDNQLSILELKF